MHLAAPAALPIHAPPWHQHQEPTRLKPQTHQAESCQPGQPSVRGRLAQTSGPARGLLAKLDLQTVLTQPASLPKGRGASDHEPTRALAAHSAPPTIP